MPNSKASEGLLTTLDPPPVQVVNADGRADFVLICEHAGAAIPKHLADLGLPATEMLRHIAHDVGAEGVARVLAAQLDAPLLLQPYSRLVVDCNRPFSATDCIPEVSDGTIVPGNLRLSERDRRARYAEIHEPFHREVTLLLDRRAAGGSPTILVAVHSFTRRLVGGPERPWQLGVLSNRDAKFAKLFLAGFQSEHPTIASAHNEPYLVDDISDYTIPVHGEARGLPHLLLEIRNDLIGDAEGQRRWAALIAEALTDTKAKESMNG